MALLIGLIAGALAGVLTGAIARSLRLGLWSNTLIGMAGGGGAALAAAALGLDGMTASLAAQATTGAAGGLVLSVAAGVVLDLLR